MTEIVAMPGIAVAPDMSLMPVKQRRRPPALVLISIGWLTLVVLAAACADLLPLADPDVDVGQGASRPPLRILSEPLGTDSFGRSVLSRLILGARTSLGVSLAAAALALVIGLAFGIAAGYFRGAVDGVIGWLLDSVLAFPGLVLLMALSATLRPSVRTVIVGLTFLAFPAFARLARASTLRIASADFVVAERGLGAKARTILTRELAPNVAATLIAYAGVVAASLVLAESALSFLALSVPPPAASWGSMIADGRAHLRVSPQLVFVPAVTLFFTVFSLNEIGEWLRSRSDATSKLSGS